jgi:DNA-binding transcriptional MerR regulator
MVMPNMYRAATVCEVTGIKPVTLRQWHLRGIYTPETEQYRAWFEFASAMGGSPTVSGEVFRQLTEEVENARRMGWRLYTLADIIRIEIALRLTKLRVSPERAAAIANRCYVETAIPDPRRIHITAGGKELPPKQPGAVKGDRFAVALQPPDYDDVDNEKAEEWALDNSVSHCGISQIGEQFTVTAANDVLRRLWLPEVGIVINVTEIARLVKAKLDSLTNAGPQG